MRLLLLFVSMFCAGNIFAQNKYFVYLKDKTGTEFKISEPGKFLSPRSLNRRTTQRINITARDLPVSATYVNQIKTTGAKVTGSSKWLNAILLEATPTQLTAIKALPFVLSVDGNTSINGLRLAGPLKNKWENGTEIDFNYGSALPQIQQLGADEMHKKDITGKGMLVGILDSGFDRANTIDALKTIFTEKRVLDTYDFVDREVNVYNEDGHGTAVMSCIGANLTGKLIGTAPDASFVLYRTEDVYSESKIEEVYWLFAAEKADSIGVDVINSSLGYTTFDNAAQDYKYADMTGDKTICARAADFAVGVGISVVVSAGNDGNNTWKYVGTPADADSVISVGAVDLNGNISSFSSFGPNAKKNIKPELVARGTGTVVASGSNGIGGANGTSFSSPVMAGFVASFKSAYPRIPAMKIKEIMIKSANLYLTPNERFGYGLPSFGKAVVLADEYMKTLILASEQENSVDLLIYPNPISDNDFSISYKNVDLGPNTNIKIYQKSTGAILIDSNLETAKKDIKKLPSGTYLLSTNSPEGKIIQKSFIKL
jgi:serine protease AprX